METLLFLKSGSILGIFNSSEWISNVGSQIIHKGSLELDN